MHSTSSKTEQLQDILYEMSRVAIAFSGGVDSTFLLAFAHRLLHDNVLAVIVSSVFMPRRELDDAVSFCENRGIPYVIEQIDVLANETVRQNPKNRCYHCKKSLLEQIRQTAAVRHFDWVCEGSNLDDTKDYRPGMRAIQELHVRSPLLECRMTKADIRAASAEMGLPTAEKPSFACLASRIPYGEPIDPTVLQQIERSECELQALGFRQFRVRAHGSLARIEVLPEDFPALLAARHDITAKLQKNGFTYVTMDMTGYRTGSMNETQKTDSDSNTI